jgi:hypothetical protein
MTMRVCGDTPLRCSRGYPVRLRPTPGAAGCPGAAPAPSVRGRRPHQGLPAGRRGRRAVRRRAGGAHLVTLDHHRGSEENQPGWEWHDASLVDPHTGRLETLPSLRQTLWDAGLDGVVSVLVATTQQVAPWWTTPLTLLFLDGNHTEQVAQHDYAGFAPHVVPGGTLLVHDVFERPEDGGRPPWNVFRRAVDSGAFAETDVQGSLRVLRRLDAPVA